MLIMMKKMMRLAVSALFVSSLNVITASAADTPPIMMTGDRMKELIQEQDPSAVVVAGYNRVQFSRHEQPVELIFDVHADRMRLIAPIKPTEELRDDEMPRMLEANFHTTLDVRYAASGGTVYAAYLHPLHSLEEEQFLGAMDMVAMAAKTFGTNYSAGSLTFYGSGSVVGTTSTTTTTSTNTASFATSTDSFEKSSSSSDDITVTPLLRTEMAREMESEGPPN
mmetsp:Transcript_121957/g.182099  ORF Transcript_121957/g.182099 Transcript_121957/m.182099 type:complete len:224 (-) Transcript_121957:193-864(-)